MRGVKRGKTNRILKQFFKFICYHQLPTLFAEVGRKKENEKGKKEHRSIFVFAI